jgi:Xaa-Pro aminopeptidase
VVTVKSDLDELMQERGLDAALAAGSVHGNPALYYLTSGAGLTRGMVLKKRGEEPILLCWPMEREEAAGSGLRVENLGRYDYAKLEREAGNPLDATIALHRRIFADFDVSGRVGFYGNADRGAAWVLLNALNDQLDGIEVVGEFDGGLITAARATKDEGEGERIREVGRRTGEVVAGTIDFIRSHEVGDEILLLPDSSPLTLGHVRQEVNRLMAERELEDPEGFILSIGRDAGVPHNKGRPVDVVMLGQTIVFDIFPREQGGGYFFDMTRTFCLGYAPREVEEAYEDVIECQQMLLEAYEVGTEARQYQQMACDSFASRGHPTVGEDSQTESGYVHNVGHGLGLDIHEEPSFRDQEHNTDLLKPGHVFTCEPGLYYPHKGFGVRIEDVLWIDAEGMVHNLTPFPKDLVIEVG